MQEDEPLEEQLNVSNSSFCCYPGELVAKTAQRTVWRVSTVSLLTLALWLSFVKTCDYGTVVIVLVFLYLIQLSWSYNNI